MSGVVCPQCGHDDRIQKVQAAVVGGISEVRSSGGFGGITYSGGQWGAFGGPSATRGTASTLLAQRLLPPDEPKVRYPGRWAWSFLPESFHEWYHFKIEPLWDGCGLIAFSVLSILLVLLAVVGLISGDSGAVSAFCGASSVGFLPCIFREEGAATARRKSASRLNVSCGNRPWPAGLAFTTAPAMILSSTRKPASRATQPTCTSFSTPVYTDKGVWTDTAPRFPPVRPVQRGKT